MSERTRTNTGVEHGNEIMEAVEALQGSPMTSEIADYCSLAHTTTLVAAGKLNHYGLLELVKARPANPRWQLPGSNDIGF